MAGLNLGVDLNCKWIWYSFFVFIFFLKKKKKKQNTTQFISKTYSLLGSYSVRISNKHRCLRFRLVASLSQLNNSNVISIQFESFGHLLSWQLFCLNLSPFYKPWLRCSSKWEKKKRTSFKVMLCKITVELFSLQYLFAVKMKLLLLLPTDDSLRLAERLD